MSHTCIGQQGLQCTPHPVIGQQLLGGLMPQQHTQHGLGIMPVSGVGVTRDTEAQQGLCE